MNNSSKSPVSEVAARTAFLIIITLLSLFGNSIVFITLYRRQYLLTPSNKLVFSLTSANFVFSIIVMPFVIAGSAMEQWYFGRVWCSITGFLTLLVKGASMLLLAGIACDRYYAIVHPMSYPRKITGLRATVVIIVCWVIAAICATPPLFGGWSKYEFHPQRSGCLPVWQKEIGYTLFWIILCFFLPYCTMLGCYFSIFKVARKKTRQVNIKVDCTPRHSSEDDLSNSQDSSDSYTDAFPTTRVIDDARDVSRKDSDNAEADSGINVSGSTHASTIANEYAADQRQRSKEPPPKVYSDCTRLYLPNQVECKDSPKFTSRRRSMGLDSDMMSEDPPIRSARKSSNASIISSTSQVFRRTSLAFSAVKYYSNQMKAVFTIAFILGILLCTMGPFVIVALVEAFHSSEEVVSSKFDSPVSQVTLSVSTCFFYLTCVYYPLFYGLWNRTVRKEMRQLLCGNKQRETYPTRVRILSLATHIQDLGMSPGLTAAIISGSDTSALGGTSTHDRHHRHRRRSAYNLPALREPEPPPVISNKRRHTLHSLPALSLPQTSNGGGSIGYPFHSRHGGLHSWVSRDAFHGRHGIGVIAEESEKETASDTDEATYNGNNMRRWRNGYSFSTVTDLIDDSREKEAAARNISKDDSNENMQSKFGTRSRDIHISRCQSMKSRTREKPATSGLLELTSAEVLSNTALSSALLFTGCGTKSSKGFDMYTMTNGQTICRVDDDVPPKLATPEIIVTNGDSNENVDIIENNVTVNNGNRLEENGISTQEGGDAAFSNEANALDSQDGLFINFTNNKAYVQSTDQKICDSANHITSTNETDESCQSNAAIFSMPHDLLTKSSAPINQDCSNCDAMGGGDAMSLLTGGRIHGSNLVHLEAGEPIAVRQWSQSQFVDFFASSIAYGVVEAGKTVVDGAENEDT